MSDKQFRQKFKKQIKIIEGLDSDSSVQLEIIQPNKKYIPDCVPLKGRELYNQIFSARATNYKDLKQKNNQKVQQATLDLSYGFTRVPPSMAIKTEPQISQKPQKPINGGMTEAQIRKFKNQILKKQQDQIFRKSRQAQRQKQIQKQKNLERKRQDAEKKIALRQQNKRKKNDQISSLLGNLISFSDENEKKKRVLQQLNQQDKGLKNIQILNNMQEQMEPEGPDFQDLEEKQQRKRKYLSMIGTNEMINNYKPRSTATLIKLILNHDFYNQSMKQETNRVPAEFDDAFTYVKTFHYLLANQCIADLRQRLTKLENDYNLEVIKATILNTRKNIDGYTQLLLRQKILNSNQTTLNDKEKFLLKNFSLSRNRLGLITNTLPFKKKNFGVPSKQNKLQFTFICMLLTPQTKQDLNSDIKAICSIKESELQLIMRQTKSNQIYFLDFEKLSTIMREYKAISDLPLFSLAPFILKPRLAQTHHSDIIQQREVLDPLLKILEKQFNQIQFNSIRQMVLKQHGVVMLQGPPGTGKTSTLLGLLAAQYQYLNKMKSNLKIMICAPSNAAIDHITKRIVNQGLLCGEGQGIRVKPLILRTGIVQTQDPDITQVSLQHICDKQIFKTKEGNKLGDMSTPAIKQKLESLQKEMKKLLVEKKVKSSTQLQQKITGKQQDINFFERQLFQFRRQKVVLKNQYSQIEKRCLDYAQIILTTLSSSGAEKMDKIKGRIGCLIVDQAAQATQPNLLIALQTGVQKILLIGDPYQLPATVISTDAANTFFNRSLFQRFLDAGLKPYFLNYQYRMAPKIRQFPSKMFYQNRLKDDQSVMQRVIPKQLENFKDRNAIFLDVHFGRDKKRDNSYINQAQSEVIAQLLNKIEYNFANVGIITPYQSQRKSILRKLKYSMPSRQSEIQSIMINTVDSFQGQQKDIIIISCVRSNQEGNLGFMIDQRRTNVALTRAKFLMIVVGNGDTLGSNQIWDQFLSFCSNRKSYYKINFRAECEKIIQNMIQGQNKIQISRKYYSNKTKDSRKQQRNLIQSTHFNGSSKKKVKPNEQIDLCYIIKSNPSIKNQIQKRQKKDNNNLKELETPSKYQETRLYNQVGYQYKPSAHSKSKFQKQRKQQYINLKNNKKNFNANYNIKYTQKNTNKKPENSNNILKSQKRSSQQNFQKILQQKKNKLQQMFKIQEVNKNLNAIQKKIKNGQIQDDFLKQLYK